MTPEPLRLQTHVAGEGGHPLALVGGGLTGWRSWEPHQQRLAGTRQVIRIQPLSVQYGLEGRPLPAGYSIDLEADALGAALDAAGVRTVDLVAWSYGALVALDFALDHPARIRSLTLIEPPALWVLDQTGGHDDQTRAESAQLRALYANMTDDVTPEQLATFAIQAGLVPPNKRAEDLPQWPSWLEHRRSLRTGDAIWRHRDDAARLRSFDRPVLLVRGVGTAHFLDRIVDALAASLPTAEQLELPAGHAPQLVSFDAFLAALTGFIDRAAAVAQEPR